MIPFYKGLYNNINLFLISQASRIYRYRFNWPFSDCCTVLIFTTDKQVHLKMFTARIHMWTWNVNDSKKEWHLVIQKASFRFHAVFHVQTPIQHHDDFCQELPPLLRSPFGLVKLNPVKLPEVKRTRRKSIFAAVFMDVAWVMSQDLDVRRFGAWSASSEAHDGLLSSDLFKYDDWKSCVSGLGILLQCYGVAVWYHSILLAPIITFDWWSWV